MYFFPHFRSKRYLNFIPEANFANFASFPLSIPLSLNALSFSSTKNITDIEYPLLPEKNREVGGDFDKAGIWSKVTFRWLNPLFQVGRTRKLELSHIPSVPRDESAEKSFSSLHESIASQETKAFSLSKALLHAVWRPLAVNAVFAGMNTIASYMGPLLITNFVDFLSKKHDDSSHYYGTFLAICFLLAKTVESLSQRQLCFGAHRIGIRIRSALMVLIYRKFLSNYSGSNNGKIVNFINVDAEKIGDFSSCIHGVWLLPLQVFLALVILWKNLGIWPSITALVAAAFVVAGTSPLAKLSVGRVSRHSQSSHSP